MPSFLFFKNELKNQKISKEHFKKIPKIKKRFYENAKIPC